MEDNNNLNAVASLIVNSMEQSRREAISAGNSSIGNTKRTSLYDEFGYPKRLSFTHFYNAYDRNEAAGAAIEITLDNCWSDYPEIYEGDETKESTNFTPWDKKVNKIFKGLWEKIKDADKKNLIGRYSALIIQVKDNRPWDEEIDLSVVKNSREFALLRLIPVWEAQLDVADRETNQEHENFGFPTMYTFTELPVEQEAIDLPGRIINVHPSRVIILAEGSENGHMETGRSLLRTGFNKILDIEKVTGGAAEGFLKNASRQLNFSFSEKTDFHALAEALGVKYSELKAAMTEQVKKLNNNTDSSIIMQEGTAQVLSVTIDDPTPTTTTALSLFCATFQCPLKIFIGMQTGERASREDEKRWSKVGNARRNSFLTNVITEIVKRFWTYGFIEAPESGEITISWSDLLEPTDSEKIEKAKTLAEIADKTQGSFGYSVISEREIRTAAGLSPEPEEPFEQPPSNRSDKRDPLTDEKPTNRIADNTTKQE
ncbi:Protein of uncharacterised function (DUF1073) [Yersinia frederiksenii]|nr:Protein of uncharacterised function (DUF1073) [Yersinia frederiksenii]